MSVNVTVLKSINYTFVQITTLSVCFCLVYEDAKQKHHKLKITKIGDLYP